MKLYDYFKEKNIDITIFEGYCQESIEESNFLKEIVTNKPYKNIMEIGFNAGHSAEIFLENNSTLHVTSFELGKHKYTRKGKKFMDKKYKNRHTLIYGNSIEAIPKFIKENKDVKFDLIFIDGSHHYDLVKQDLENCKELSHKDTIVILDDTNTIPSLVKKWQIGPNRVWKEGKENNMIIELGALNFPPRHGLSWGKYIFK